MPKKTKTKKKSKSGIWSKISLSSPKKKLLAFALIFGVIAGGYFVYSSFAATPGEDSTGKSSFYFTEPGKAKYITNGNAKRATIVDISADSDDWRDESTATVFGSPTYDNCSIADSNTGVCSPYKRSTFALQTGVRDSKLINVGDLFALPQGVSETRVCVTAKDTGSIKSDLDIVYYTASKQYTNADGYMLADRANDRLAEYPRDSYGTKCSGWYSNTSFEGKSISYIGNLEIGPRKGAMRISGFSIEWR